MRRLCGPLLAALLAGCAGAPPAPIVLPPPPPPPLAANLEVTVEEAVGSSEADGYAYARVFVGGRELGQTEAGPRSAPKRWSGRLEPGNHPLRLEYWTLPGVGEWERLPADWQPRERFVRVEAGKRTRMRLRFTDGGRRHQPPAMTREELGP